MRVDWSVKLVDSGVFGASFTRRIDAFRAQEIAARRTAATTATQVTRASFHHSRPQNVPNRPGRDNPLPMLQALRWVPSGNGVAFDIAEANYQAPYWIIQEIGTGQSAGLLRDGVKFGRGRRAVGAPNTISVRSQVGRRISGRLAWGTGPAGTWVAPGGGTGQQLYLRALLKGGAAARGGMRIKREIKGQHMVQQGGNQGFRTYRTEVQAAARRAFGGRPWSP